MKKALVISLYSDRLNYGNKLQNYAVQYLIEQCGYKAEVLRYKRSKKISLEQISIKKIIMKIINKFNNNTIPKEIINKRKVNFANFCEKINFTKKIAITDQDYIDLNNNYDLNVIGSDQIWGLSISYSDKIAFASFSPKDKNISIAASFGIEKIPQKAKKRYIAGLNNISHISVREETGKKLVKELLGTEPEIVIDPTMAVPINVWDEFEKKPEFLNNEKFILTYFVQGNVKERKNKIKELAQNKKMKVISLNDFEDLEAYTIGPMEFIYLIKHAELIYTDSFHCAVFSILYKKDFYTMSRADNADKSNSRIQTLLTRFGLTSRIINDVTDQTTHCIYNKSDEIIEKEKEKILNFLKSSMTKKGD